MWHRMPLLISLVGISYAALAVYASDTVVWGPSDITARFEVLPRYDLCCQSIDGSPSWTLTRHVAWYGWCPAIKEVTQSGSNFPYVFGVAAGQFFLLRVSERSSEQEDLRMFVTREEWVSALASCGIKEGYVLSPPQEIASSRPLTELRPWEYNCLKGLAGLKDETWATVLTLGVFLGGAVVGLFSGRLRGALIVMTLIGVIVGVAGDTLVFEGPAVGMIGTPICTAVAVVLGWSLRFLVKRCVHPSRKG